MKAGKVCTYCFRLSSRRGVSLILSVSVMMLLSIMAVTFIRLATYEQAASNNYLAIVDARLTAYAGFDRAMAEIYGQLVTTGRVDWEGEEAKWAGSGNPGANGAKNVVIAYPKASTRHDLAAASASNAIISMTSAAPSLAPLTVAGSTYSVSGVIGRGTGLADLVGRYDLNGNFYCLKIIPPSHGRLNVNSHISSTVNNSASNRVLREILETLAQESGFTGNLSTPGSQVAAVVNAIRASAANPPHLQSKFFQNREDLSNAILGIGSAAAREKFLKNLCTDSWINDSGLVAQRAASTGAPDSYAITGERRAPINVNYISDELLYALVANIKGMAVFYQNSASYTPVMLKNGVEYRTETSLAHVATPVPINFRSLPSGNIDNIVSQIKNSAYLNQTTQSPRYNDRLKFNGAIEGNYSPTVGTLSFVGIGNQPTWLNNDIWNQAWLDALKSNFSPNGSNGFYNMNRGSYRRVGKAQLYYDDSGTIRPGHTTELCFNDNLGSVAIESLGRITARGSQTIVATATVKAKVNFATLLRHHTQAHFEAAPAPTTVITFPPKPVGVASTREGQVLPKPNDPPTADFTMPTTNETQLQADTTAWGCNPLLLLSKANYDINPDGVYCSSRHNNTERRYVTKAVGIDKNLLTVDPVGGANIGNYKGAIEFWIKLTDQVGRGEGDKERGVSCGILGITTKSANYNPVTRNASYVAHGDIGNVTDKVSGSPSVREGTQLYAYLDTKGELRVTRLYWGIFYDGSLTSPDGPWRGLIFDLDTMPTVIPGADSARKVPRRDVVVNVAPSGLNWQPHEWHHVFISWDDNAEHTAGTNSLKVVIDDITQSDPIMVDNDKIGDFAVLNEMNTKDGMFVNGFKRSQPQSGGYFHFDSVFFYPGNSTIDAFVSQKGNSVTTPSHAHRDRYPTSQAFSRTFVIGGEGLIAGPVRWECYTDDPDDVLYNTNPDSRNVKLQMQVKINGTIIGGVATAANSQYLPSASNAANISNRILHNLDNLTYTATFGSTSQRCMTLDSVNAYLYYTYPRFIEFEYPSN